MIELRHLRKEYETVTPLEDVSTVINEGDVISVIGPSGTGKSTLLRCINLMEEPTSGEIIINGQNILDENADIDKIRLKVGMVFQAFNLYGHLTVLENIMLAQTVLLKRSRQEAYNKAMENLILVGLQDKALQYPDQLSGGQKQRAAIARTLAMDPDIILFDEPTSALDPRMTYEVLSVIEYLANIGKTMMIVTHSMEFAQRVSNRVFYMDEGGIYEDGPVEQIFKNPHKDKTRSFITGMSTLTIEIPYGTVDLPGCMAKIFDYGTSQFFHTRVIYGMQMLFEELFCSYYLKQMKPGNTVIFMFEYEPFKDTMRVVTRYNMDEMEDWDVESTVYKMISHAIKRYTWNDERDEDGFAQSEFIMWEEGKQND